MEPLPLPPPRHWTLPSSYGADLYNEPLSDGAEKGGWGGGGSAGVGIPTFIKSVELFGKLVCL